MPLQPNIALQVQGLQLPDPMAQAGRVAQIQNALQQQRMGDIQLQNALREQRREQDYETVLSGFTPDMDLKNRVAALQQRGLGAKAAQYAKTQLEMEKANREAQAARIKATMDQAKLTAQLYGSAKDQETLDFVNERLRSVLDPIDHAALPKVYSPEGVKSVLDAGMSTVERLTAETNRQRAEAATSQAKTAAEKLTQDRTPAAIQEFNAVQRMTPEQRIAYEASQASKRPQTTVNIDQQSEKAEAVARGKGYVEHETEVRKAAAAARKSLTGIESAQDVLSKGFETGFGKETLAKGASVLAALGVSDAEKFAADSQKFLQAVTERVLAAQTEQKGVQTNQDAQRIEQMGARMGNTKAANEFILDVARAQAERAIAQDKFYRDWLRDPANKKSLAGAEDAWLESEGNKSIFEAPRLKKYGVLQSERAQATVAPAGPVVGGRSATPRGPATAVPQAAIDALLKGQGTDAQFDEIFGRGAAAAARAGGR